MCCPAGQRITQNVEQQRVLYSNPVMHFVIMAMRYASQ
jgi:hypothetical protein